VTIVHSRTKDPQALVRMADIVSCRAREGRDGEGFRSPVPTSRLFLFLQFLLLHLYKSASLFVCFIFLFFLSPPPKNLTLSVLLCFMAR